MRVKYSLNFPSSALALAPISSAVLRKQLSTLLLGGSTPKQVHHAWSSMNYRARYRAFFVLQCNSLRSSAVITATIIAVVMGASLVYLRRTFFAATAGPGSENLK